MELVVPPTKAFAQSQDSLVSSPVRQAEIELSVKFPTSQDAPRVNPRKPLRIQYQGDRRRHLVVSLSTRHRYRHLLSVSVSAPVNLTDAALT